MNPESFVLLADSGEAFGSFPSYQSAHRWLVRNGLEFEPLRIIRLSSLDKCGWLVRPCPFGNWRGGALPIPTNRKKGTQHEHHNQRLPKP